MTRKGLCRVISLITTTCFLGTQSALGSPKSPASAPDSEPIPIGAISDAANSSASDLHSLIRWHVPEVLGTVQQRWQGSSDKVIFHIQDTHANYDSQMHAAQILEMLLQSPFKDKIRLLAVEGAAGRIDLSSFKVYPDKEILKGIAH